MSTCMAIILSFTHIITMPSYVLTSGKLNAIGQHWVAGLANYNFAVNYQSGKRNVDADALSCIPKGNIISRERLSMHPDLSSSTGHYHDGGLLL